MNVLQASVSASLLTKGEGISELIHWDLSTRVSEVRHECLLTGPEDLSVTFHRFVTGEPSL